MPDLKLYYFNIRGMVEPLRMMLIDNGVPFENIMIPRDEKWEQVKQQFTFAQVPFLIDGDFEIPQSGAIMRHLARKLNLEGGSNREKTFAEFFTDGVKDLHQAYANIIYRDYEKRDEFIANTYAGLWARIDKLFKIYADGEQYVLGDKISYADYVLFENLDVALVFSPSTIDSFPRLKSFHKRFGERPNLKEYLAARTTSINYNGRQ